MITPHDEPSLSPPLDTQSTSLLFSSNAAHTWMNVGNFNNLPSPTKHFHAAECLVHPSIDIPFSFTRLLIFICSVFQSPFHTQLPSPFIAIRRLWRAMMNGKWMDGRKKGNVHQVGCHLISHSTQPVFKGLFGFQLAKEPSGKLA